MFSGLLVPWRPAWMPASIPALPGFALPLPRPRPLPLPRPRPWACSCSLPPCWPLEQPKTAGSSLSTNSALLPFRASPKPLSCSFSWGMLNACATNGWGYTINICHGSTTKVQITYCFTSRDTHVSVDWGRGLQDQHLEGTALLLLTWALGWLLIWRACQVNDFHALQARSPPEASNRPRPLAHAAKFKKSQRKRKPPPHSNDDLFKIKISIEHRINKKVGPKIDCDLWKMKHVTS